MFATMRVILSLLMTVQVLGHELLLDFLNLQHENNAVKLSEKCSNDLASIKSGIEKHEIWAMKIRDASGKSSAGFIWGNNFWLGSEIACENLNNPKRIPMTRTATRRNHENVTSIASKFPVEYRMFYATHTSPIQFDSEVFEFVGLQIGICFPKSCVESEIVEMSKIIFKSGEFKQTQIYGEMSFVKTKTLKLRDDFFRDPFTVSLL